MKSKKELVGELSQTMQRIGTLTVLHTNAVASKIDLSATEFEAVDIISHYQPMTAGKLSKYCGLTSGAVTGLVDRLEKAGFVRRTNDPADRRKVLIEAIENKEKSRVISELYEPMSEAFCEMMMRCSIEEIKFLVRIHTELADKTEAIIADMRNR